MSLKYLGNFWDTLDIPLINCEVSLALTWSADCVITSMEKRITTGTNRGDSPTGAMFKITVAKLYVPVVTLSAENDNKLLEQLKTGFKGTLKWSKYRSEMSNQAKNNNVNYLIDLTFTNVNKLFVLSYGNEEDKASFSEYYLPKVQIKNFNVLIDGKPFFETPVKNKEETYEAIIEMTKSNDYTTGNSLDYEYFWKYYRLITIDLSKEIELENLDLKQKISFIGRLEESNTTMFFIIEKKKKLLLISYKIL